MAKDPRTPRNLSGYARLCLDALSRSPRTAGAISLGGAVGLAHYLEYRETHDVDAWWCESASPADRRSVIDVVAHALESTGQIVRVRKWGDVVSVDLNEREKVVFSFQIAARDARLEPPEKLPWPDGMFIDSLADLLASKMVALVERGAPRDFRDIHAVCEARLADAPGCWELWRRRQLAAARESSGVRARAAVLLHLERIELARPLARITDELDRARARAVRSWFRKEFLDALVD